MKIKNIFLLSLLSVAISGCSGEKGKLEKLNTPAWAFDPYVLMSKEDKQNKIAASGMACSTQSGLRVQIMKAEADARLSMAKQIGVEINSSLEDYVKESAGSDKQVLEFKKNFEMKSQEIIDSLPISGAYRTNIWQSEERSKDGTGCDEMLFVRMEIDRQKIADYISKSIDDYTKNVKEKKIASNFKNKVVENISEGATTSSVN